ncbi:TraB/GumN family protein [Undibacterium sp. RuRC25W]|uniref:TraB/GumN family protein n=1 Tax=Undibacterium sp. RuRC25W TaxID=3413047 RepID=UPI003BF06A19
MPLFNVARPALQTVSVVLLTLVFSSQVSAKTAAETHAKGILWEVKSDTNTAYLFGSIHLAKASFYPLPNKVQKAYQQADTLAVELDSSDRNAVVKAMPLLTYAAPDKLQNHLQPATWDALKGYVGPAAERFQILKPAMVATGLMVGTFAKGGYEPAFGVDVHFITRAKQDKKQIVELESMEFQAKILGGLTDDEGDAMLSQTITSLKSGDALRETNQLVAAWKAGDAEKVVTLLREESEQNAGSKKIMERLLDERNPAMADKIAELMAAGKHVIVVVGAGHISGPNSIADLLKKQGLQVRQIKY